MKRFLLEPGRQLVEECLLFLCSILEQPSSHPIPHPHCFLPNHNYSAINQIKQSKKKRNTNELKADKRKEKRSGKLSEKNGFIPGGVSWKIWVWLFRWGLVPPPLQRRTNSIICYPSYTAYPRDLISARKWKACLYFSRFSSYSRKIMFQGWLTGRA